MPDAPRAFPWRAAFARSPDALFVAGRSRRVRYANAAFARLTGKSASAWRGMRLSRLLSASELGRVLAIPAEVWAGEAVTVHRAPPGDAGGRANWRIDFVPVRGADHVSLVLGRIGVATPDPLAPGFAPGATLAALRAGHAAAFPWADWDAPSPAARKLLSQARFAADSRAPVWIRGPAGVGKHRLARAMHANGPARGRAFVRIDGAAVQPYLVDAQLFGKGALAASGQVGTLYVADPAALGSELRAKLLAWLGGPGVPRLVTGAEASAAELVAARRVEAAFEAELSVIELIIPPLAARPGDLPHYAELWARRAKCASPDRAALHALAAHDWPGNVRELFATLDDAAGRAGDGPISEADLPRRVRESNLLRDPRRAERPPAIPLAKLLETVERRAIAVALHQGGTPAAAARRLGVTREALRRRAAALGVPLPAKEDSP